MKLHGELCPTHSIQPFFSAVHFLPGSGLQCGRQRDRHERQRQQRQQQQQLSSRSSTAAQLGGSGNRSRRSSRSRRAAAAAAARASEARRAPVCFASYSDTHVYASAVCHYITLHWSSAADASRAARRCASLRGGRYLRNNNNNNRLVIISHPTARTVPQEQRNILQ